MEVRVKLDQGQLVEKIRHEIHERKKETGRKAVCIQLGIIEACMVLTALIEDAAFTSEAPPTLWGVPIELKGGMGHRLIEATDTTEAVKLAPVRQYVELLKVAVKDTNMEYVKELVDGLDCMCADSSQRLSLT